MASLNAERKRRAGLADTGRCDRCGRYRLLCNQGCIEFPDVTVEPMPRPFPNGRPGWHVSLFEPR